MKNLSLFMATIAALFLSGCASLPWSGKVDVIYNARTGEIRYTSTKDVNIRFTKEGDEIKEIIVESSASSAVRARAEAEQAYHQSFNEMIKRIPVMQ